MTSNQEALFKTEMIPASNPAFNPASNGVIKACDGEVYKEGYGLQIIFDDGAGGCVDFSE